MTTLSLGKAGAFFGIGYVTAGVIVTVIAHDHDDSWASGPVMLGLSSPTAIVYFFVLWAIRRWRLVSATSAGMALAGCLSALYPTISGYFPVYFMRWELALPIIIVQLLVLVVVIAISARLQKSSGCEIPRLRSG